MLIDISVIGSKGPRTFLRTYYVTRPGLLRCCIGLVQPSLSWGRVSLQYHRCPSNMGQNSGIERVDQSRW